MAASIQKALESWEVNRRQGRAIDVDAETELHREFGKKHGRLIEQSEFLKQSEMLGIEVPIPQGISNSQLQKFLSLHFPDLKSKWEILNKGFYIFL